MTKLENILKEYQELYNQTGRTPVKQENVLERLTKINADIDDFLFSPEIPPTLKAFIGILGSYLFYMHMYYQTDDPEYRSKLELQMKSAVKTIGPILEENDVETGNGS